MYTPFPNHNIHREIGCRICCVKPFTVSAVSTVNQSCIILPWTLPDWMKRAIRKMLNKLHVEFIGKVFRYFLKPRTFKIVFRNLIVRKREESENLLLFIIISRCNKFDLIAVKHSIVLFFLSFIITKGILPADLYNPPRVFHHFSRWTCASCASTRNGSFVLSSWIRQPKTDAIRSVPSLNNSQGDICLGHKI